MTEMDSVIMIGIFIFYLLIAGILFLRNLIKSTDNSVAEASVTLIILCLFFMLSIPIIIILLNLM